MLNDEYVSGSGDPSRACKLSPVFNLFGWGQCCSVCEFPYGVMRTCFNFFILLQGTHIVIIPHVLTKENVLTWKQLLPASVRIFMKEALVKFVRNFFLIYIETLNTVKNENSFFIDSYLFALKQKYMYFNIIFTKFRKFYSLICLFIYKLQELPRIKIFKHLRNTPLLFQRILICIVD